jgi:hypothetical protein
MAGKGKGQSVAQAVAAVLIVAICALTIPMPGGGLLISRLSGTEFVPERLPLDAMPVEAMPVDVPVAAVPPPAVKTPEVSWRFKRALDVFPSREELIIPADPLDPLGKEERRDWVEVTVEKKKVWVDTMNGLVWGPRLNVELSGMTRENLDRARSLCEKQKPVGSWVLPTATEFDHAKVNGILKVDSDAQHKWLTWIRIPYVEDIPAARGYGPAAAGEKYAVRCIARTPLAELNGYVMTDNAAGLRALAE